MSIEPARPKRILVIDDDKSQCNLMARSLAEAGYQVEQTYSGADGVELFKTWQPDLVLIDFAMPGMNGFEAVNEMRKLERGKSRTQIVMITAYSQTFLVSVDFQVGVDSYLTKPMLPTELVERITDLLAGYKA